MSRLWYNIRETKDQAKGSRMINPILMHPEDVERLCDKSKRIWGAKWRWRKEADRHGYTWEEIEEKLDNTFKRHEEILKKARSNVKRRTNKQLGNESGRDNGVRASEKTGANKEEVSTPGDSSSSPSGNEPVRLGSDAIDGKEVRSGEAPDGSTPSDGPE